MASDLSTCLLAAVRPHFCALVHTSPHIFRDLKPGNVLMSTSGSAKISDFGLARCKYKTYLSTKKLDAGTVAYM